MDRDGTKAGYDLALVRAVADAVPVPVIASGGGGSAESLAAALDDGPQGGHAQAALAASIFHFREITVGELKRRLLELGIAVRLPSLVVDPSPCASVRAAAPHAPDLPGIAQLFGSPPATLRVRGSVQLGETQFATRAARSSPLLLDFERAVTRGGNEERACPSSR